MIYNILSIMTLILSFLLGIYVYENDKSNKVNRSFIFLILSAMLWIFCNFMTDISSNITLVNMWSKLTIVGPIFIGYFFYKLSIFFPREKKQKGSHKISIISTITVFMILVFTRWNIEAVYLYDGQIPTIKPGPLYIFFLIYFTIITILAFKNLFNGYKKFDRFEKLQVQYISLGLGISAILGLIIDIILPLFGNSDYVNFGPYFILIFIFLTSFAIIKFKMFDIKIVATQLLIFSLWIFVLLRTLVADTLEDKLTNGGLLLLLLIFGYLLIKSVIKEISQREHIQELATDLQKANDRLMELDKQKSEFVSFATHQLRSPLTAMKGYASLILDGDLGKLSHEIRNAIMRIYDSSNTLTNIVDDYLNISQIELGTMKYYFENVDLKELVADVINELKPNIEKSKIKFSFEVDIDKKYMVNADKDKFKQIIANLVDNSIKYTPFGSTMVSLYKKDGKIIFSAKDTGIGIAEEVMPRLFSKFSRANNADKQDIHGTGLGLFVAKEIVLAHKGRIWAESAGEGKGSTFFVELEEVI